jgi:hypothetical protein
MYMDMGIYKKYMPILFVLVILFFWGLFSYGRWYTYNELFLTFKGGYDWTMKPIDSSSEGVLKLGISAGDKETTISLFPKQQGIVFVDSLATIKKDPISAGHKTGERRVIKTENGENIVYVFTYKAFVYVFSGNERVIEKILKNVIWR